MHSGIKRFAVIIAVSIALQEAYAGSSTWNLNPANNVWHTAANWTPASVPNGESDTATFGVSNTTTITVTKYAPGSDGILTSLDKLIFQEGAGSYSISVTPAGVFGVYLYLLGQGVLNNSGLAQNLLVAASGDYRQSAGLSFYNSATAGENIVITNQGGASANGASTYGAYTEFLNTSSASNATLINEGSTANGTIYGGFTNLSDYSSARSATFINNPGTVSGAAAGHTLVQTFLPGGNLGTSTFIANPATVPGAEGGWVEMDVGTCAGTSFIANGATVADCQAGQIYAFGAEYGTGLGVATFTGNGGNGANAQGGLIDVFNLPLSDQTVVIANAGTNGGLGATILIEGDPVLEPCQFQVFGNGTLDLTNATGAIAIGSLSGTGLVLLDGHTLTVGSNNFDSTFSGVIQDSGALTKFGTGTLTLSGANSYTGGTTVSAGTLIASNRIGSATGTGSLNVNAGTLGGKGIIQGAVTVGTGTGAGAVLAPSSGLNQPARLTLKKTLSFKADSTYTYKLNTKNARADQVIAKGVTIEGGAEFDFQAVANRRLTIGTVFTAISNTSISPIAGTFSNLPDGSSFTVGRNSFQVNYSGGDGNDLTLTVVP